MALDLVAEFADAKLEIAAVGLLVLGVVVAQRVIFWVRCVLIEREASAEYYDRYGR